MLKVVIFLTKLVKCKFLQQHLNHELTFNSQRGFCHIKFHTISLKMSQKVKFLV